MTIVNWDEIDTKYKWAAMDADGDVFIYEYRPIISKYQCHYINNKGICGDVKFIVNVVGRCGSQLWRESLEERPQK